MSLINDALKKAAHQRAEAQSDLPPVPGGGPRPSRQGAPMRTQTLILIGAGAVALIVISAVVTGMLLSNKPAAAPAPLPVVAKAPEPTPTPTPKPAVVVSAPTISLPSAEKPVPTAAPTAAPVVVVAQAPAPTAAPKPAVSRVDQIQSVIDHYHVSGVRAGSKALIDGHIFKVNDVLDKALGLKLTAVDDDHLTFTDASGETFVKNF